MKAVIDRIEGSTAVVLLGEKEVKIDVPISKLPKGSREGSWLKVNFDLDPEGEKNQREKIANLIEKLKDRGR